MKRNTLLMVMMVCLFVAQSFAAETLSKKGVVKIKSPNKDYELSVYQVKSGKNSSTAHFSVSYKKRAVVSEGRLALDINGQAWCDNLKLLSINRDEVDNYWTPVYGERSTIKDKYNEMIVKLGNSEREINVIARAYNEGVAFQYEILTPDGQPMVITAENTSFTMPESTMAYYSTWAQGPYELVALEGWEKDCERPVTMKLDRGLTVAIGEAAMVDYARGRFNLDDKKPNTLVTKLASEVEFTAPYKTPWRTIMVGKKPTDLINNNDLFLNLNEPCKIEDTSWIKPGKVFRATILDQKGAMEGVDFAAARGLQYAHLDAGWYGPERDPNSNARMVQPERDLQMKELCDYAASKGVGIMLYVNKIALMSYLDELLPIYKEWGIKGIKFGFVDVGDQKSTKWLHEAVAKCAEYEMLVDIHDEYRPTGFSRTYPNLLTQEGIRGNEEMPDSFNNLMLPYTRFLCGAGDYTICYFSNRIKTTRAHQLAMAAVYYSPFQFMFWYDKPSLYRGEKELEYWYNIPAVWDDSRALDGEIGEYITMARRSGKEWFVGVMTTGERTVNIDTHDFLAEGKSYRLKIYHDNTKLMSRTKVEITTHIVQKGDIITLGLIENGGAALHFTVEEEFAEKPKGYEPKHTMPGSKFKILSDPEYK